MRWILMLGAMLSLAACAAGTADKPITEAKPVSEQKLRELPVDTNWRLVESAVAGLAGEKIGAIRLEVGAGQLQGDTGCNRFFAGYEMGADGDLQMQSAVASKRACVDQEMNRNERAFLDALARINAARMAGERLVLMLSDGSELSFVPDPVVAE